MSSTFNFSRIGVIFPNYGAEELVQLKESLQTNVEEIQGMSTRMARIAFEIRTKEFQKVEMLRITQTTLKSGFLMNLAVDELNMQLGIVQRHHKKFIFNSLSNFVQTTEVLRGMLLKLFGLLERVLEELKKRHLSTMETAESHANQVYKGPEALWQPIAEVAAAAKTFLSALKSEYESNLSEIAQVEIEEFILGDIEEEDLLNLLEVP